MVKLSAEGGSKMSKRGTGVAFIMIAAFLIVAKYLTAAIYGSGMQSWDAELFNYTLGYVGKTLSNLSLLSFFIGIAYIVWGEYSELKSKKSKRSDL